MAGSLNHIVTPDGGFSFELIDHLGDAHEMAEQCFDIIALLVDGDLNRLNTLLREHRFPEVGAAPVFGRRSEFPDEE